MKTKIYLLVLLYFCVSNAYSQQVIVSDDASYTTPASGAMLDVKSTSKGFMMPRVALTSLTDQTTVASPATGLMVYNTGAGALTEKGIYFWNGTVWEKELSAGSSSTNYVKIADDGTVTLSGSATTFTDLVVPVYSARNSTSTTPAWSLFASPGFYSFAFTDGTNDDNKEVFFNVQMPHDYKEGSTIYPHIHWSTTAALGTTRPVWKLEYQWVNLNDNYVSTALTPITAYRIVQAGGGLEPIDAAPPFYPTTNLSGIRTSMITPLGSIVGTGKKISSVLLMRLTRATNDTNDTFTDAAGAFLISFDIHYEIDSFGSSAEYVK